MWVGLLPACGEGWWDIEEPPDQLDRPSCPDGEGLSRAVTVEGFGGASARGLGWDGASLWTVTSAGQGRIWVIDPDSGETEEVVGLVDLPRGDWLDLALVSGGRGDGELWLLDREAGGRSEAHFGLHRLEVSAGDAPSVWSVESWGLRFPDGRRRVPTALAVDGAGREADGWLVVTEEEGGQVSVWWADDPDEDELMEVGTWTERGSIGSMDASPAWLAARSAQDTTLYPRARRESLDGAAQASPCRVSSGDGLQGVGVALGFEGLWVLGGGSRPELFRYPLEGAGGASGSDR